MTGIVETLAKISCIQYLEEKHVRLTPEKSMNEFTIQKFNGNEREYQLRMSLFETKDYGKQYDFSEKGFVQIGVGEFIYIRWVSYTVYYTGYTKIQ